MEQDRGPCSEVTLDERVEETAQRVVAHLRGKIGRFVGYSSALEGCPEEVRAEIRRGVEQDMVAAARMAALPPEVRQAQETEALRRLRRMPGFIAIHINRQR